VFKILLMNYFFLLNSLYSCNPSENNNTEGILTTDWYVISLGSNCMPALHAQHHELRTLAFPFDWNFTPFKSLISLIKNDFQDFCELKYLYINNRSTSDAVSNTKYQFVIHHTFRPIDWENSPNGLIPLNQEAMEYFEEIKSMFQRRIERFIQIMHSGVPVYLLRFEDINQNQAEELYTLLKEKYPLSNFLLVCIDEYYKKNVNTWESPNKKIYHFYLNPTHRLITDSTLEKPHECFTKIFSELGLLKTK
jgi:hypothetical protein